MSRTSWILTAAGGAAAVTAATAWVTGRSRPHDSSLGVARPPGDLPPSRTVSLDGHGEIFFRDQPGPADKPPIVLVHGWVVSADLNWFTTYGALEEMGRVIAPDHRGHGRGARHSMPFRLADVADDIAALLRAEGTGPAIIVGYSMGGPLTQLLWQRHPDVVAGVVLCATAAHFNFSTVTALGWRFITLYQLGQRLLPRTWIERVLLTQAQDAVGPNLLRRAAPGISELSPLLPWVVGELQRGEIEDLAEAGRELSRFDSRGWITGIDVPSAVVVTTRDRLVPPSAQLQLVDLLDDPLVVEVEGDHDASAAMATEFNSALRKAIDHIASRNDTRIGGVA